MKRNDVVGGLVRSRMVVTLDDGSGFEGVLVDQDERAFVLASAAGEPVLHYPAGGGEPTPVEGEVMVLADRVMFCQLEGGRR